MFEGFNDCYHLIFALFSSCIFMGFIFLAFRKKAKGKQSLLLKEQNLGVFNYSFLILAALDLLAAIFKKQNINEMVKSWFSITTMVNLYFTFGQKRALTTIGIEYYAIKGQPFSIIYWSSIKDWSISVKEKKTSKSIIKYGYEHKGKRKSGEIEIFTDESEKVREVLEAYVIKV